MSLEVHSCPAICIHRQVKAVRFDELAHLSISGDFTQEATLVPIPNTTVKLPGPMIVPTSAKVGYCRNPSKSLRLVVLARDNDRRFFVARGGRVVPSVSRPQLSACGI